MNSATYPWAPCRTSLRSLLLNERCTCSGAVAVEQHLTVQYGRIVEQNTYEELRRGDIRRAVVRMVHVQGGQSTQVTK